MKYTKIIIAVISFSIGINACTKKCEVPPKTEAELAAGKWIGKFGIGTLIPTYDLTLLLNDDGEIVVINGAGSTAQAKGVWLVVGTTFKAVYTFEGTNDYYEIIGTISGNNTLNGKYELIGATTPTEGQIFCTKQ
jgi:hypothetical protein